MGEPITEWRRLGGEQVVEFTCCLRDTRETSTWSLGGGLGWRYKYGSCQHLDVSQQKWMKSRERQCKGAHHSLDHSLIWSSYLPMKEVLLSSFSDEKTNPPPLAPTWTCPRPDTLFLSIFWLPVLCHSHFSMMPFRTSARAFPPLLLSPPWLNTHMWQALCWAYVGGESRNALILWSLPSKQATAVHWYRAP